MHLQKMVSTFYKDYPEKPTVTSAPLDSVLLMARPTVKLTKPLKQKQEQSAKRRITKHIKWSNKKGIPVSAAFWS